MNMVKKWMKMAWISQKCSSSISLPPCTVLLFYLKKTLLPPSVHHFDWGLSFNHKSKTLGHMNRSEYPITPRHFWPVIVFTSCYLVLDLVNIRISFMGFRLREVLEQLPPKNVQNIFSTVDDLNMVQLTQEMQQKFKEVKKRQKMH